MLPFFDTAVLDYLKRLAKAPEAPEHRFPAAFGTAIKNLFDVITSKRPPSTT